MFFRSVCRKLYCKQKRFSIFVGFLNVFVLCSVYYITLPARILQNESHLEERLPKFERINAVTKVHDGTHFLNYNGVKGLSDDKMSSKGGPVPENSKFISKKEKKLISLTMKGCPVDWPHEVISNDSTGMPTAQVCRNSKGDGQWKCAKGWKSVHSDPYCIKNPTPPPTGLFVSSGKKNHEFQTLRQFVSENLKLLFYQLPGIVVEISPSVFRVLSMKEIFDQSSLEHYLKFTFIMHPCLRLIKLWETMVNPAVNVSFTSFVNGLLPEWKPLLLFDEKHFKTQAEMLFGNTTQVFLDQILVFERWNESISTLIRGMNTDVKNLELLKAMSSNNEKCNGMYTNETWSKMTNIYATDFCVFQYSTKVGEMQIIPPLDLMMQAFASRYNACRQESTDRNASVHINSSRSVVTSMNPCTIHTYYQPAYDDPRVNIDTQGVLSVWEKTWASAGWQTRVLNESNAMLHPDYEYLKKQFLSFPTTNAKRYTVGNFIRHIAMATVGGGWMSDYDMLPLHFPPCSKIPFNGSFTVWSGFVPALLSGNGSEYTRVAHLMADVGLQWWALPKLFLEKDGRAQVSDMKTLSVLVKKGHVKCFEVIIETSDYMQEGFSCNKATRFFTRYYPSSFPEGMSSLPWGVHLSHAYMIYMRNNNITVWPGLSWEKQIANPSPSFRKTFIKYVYNVYLEKCKF